MRIRASVEICVGAAQCVMIAPGIFDVDDDGKVVVLVAEVDEDRARVVREAVLACPSFALEVVEQ